MKSIFLILFFSITAANSSFAQNLSTTLAPDFSFLDLEGNEHNLYHALDQGFIVVLDFFFVDCPPCIDAAPEIEAIHEDYEGKNVLVWSISDRDSDDYIAQYQNNLDLSNTAGGIDGGGYDVIDLYASNFTFIGFPTISVICPNKVLNWDIFPYSIGAPEWRAAIDNCGVVEASQEYVPIGVATSLSEEVQNPELNATLSPNPVKDIAKLNFELKEARILSVNIINSLGQVQNLHSNLNLNTGQQELDLLLSDFPKGIYFLEIKSSAEVLEKIKFIKN